MPGRITVSRLRVMVRDLDGALDASVVRRTVRRHVAKLEYCYEKELSMKPDLARELVVAIHADADGSTVSATSGGDAGVAGCAKRVFDAMRFPAAGDTTRAVIDLTYSKST